MMKTENTSKFAVYAPISSETYTLKKGATPSKFSGRHKRYRITYRISVPITNRYRNYRYRFIDGHSGPNTHRDGILGPHQRSRQYSRQYSRQRRCHSHKLQTLGTTSSPSAPIRAPHPCGV